MRIVSNRTPHHFRIAAAIRSALVFSALFLAAFSTVAATFTASLDRDSVVVGEPVTLTLSFQGGQPQEISQLPQIDGLRTVSGVSQNFTSVNGQATFSYTLSLAANRAGEFVIPAFHARVNGQELSSEPLTLKVAATDRFAPPADYANKAVFLWPVIPKRQLFVGEPVIAEIRLYVRSDVRRFAQVQIPMTGDGFTFSKFVEGQHFQRFLGNAQFTIVPLSIAMTPVKSGPLKVGPISGSIVLNPRDAFDFDGFFGQVSRPQQVALSLPAMNFQVSPLPSENVPPEFSGAVGDYQLSVTAGPTNVAAGDPITLKIQITGDGPLDAIALPEQTSLENFKTYPPTSKVETSDPFGLQGTKTFEQVIVPQNPEIKAVPPISFSYFDPAKKTYETLTDPAIPLTVRPGGATPAPTVAVASKPSENPPPARDILPIRQRIGVLSQIAPPLVQRPGFLAFQSIPLIAFAGILIWRKRRDSLANNPRLRRQRQVAQIESDGLKELRKLAAENNSDDFFATLFRLLQERLGERLDLPASAITEAVVDEQLSPRGVEDSTLSELRDLFQLCNLARYAPIKSSQELAAIIPKLENVLGKLREARL